MVLGFNKQFVDPIMQGIKVHTLRDDPHNRWKPGVKMHQAVGVRTSSYECFNEAYCESTQQVIMTHTPQRGLEVWVDGKKLDEDTIDTLVKKDGFAQRAAFIDWFFTGKEDDVKKKLLHWTDLRY